MELHGLLDTILHNLFKPLLLFFFLGFSIPILRVPFEFPKPLYQSLTLYLLVSIGWHGGEELAGLSLAELPRALAFMAVGFGTNLLIGGLAYLLLRRLTRLRSVDAAAVAGHYGSDSAGTFVTCIGVLSAAHIAFDAYMPVMLAIMEIPGCLVALVLIGRLRRRGMDTQGHLPDEPGYEEPCATEPSQAPADKPEVLREILLNPGIYLIFGGLAVGLLSRLQGVAVTEADDRLFVGLFPALLCLFLMEMGMTAAQRLRDVRHAGWRFVMFALVSPNVFAGLGILLVHGFGFVVGQPMELGSYVLFAVLCGAASYISVPALQRLAFPEASPTLPLAASLGLTFSYNVTLGIPIYLLLAQNLIQWAPLG